MKKIPHISQHFAFYSAGYSLIELLVTSCISAIITCITIPYFSSLITRNNVIKEMHEIISILQLAKLTALENARDIKITIEQNKIKTCHSENAKLCQSSRNFKSNLVLNSSDSTNINLYSSGTASPATLLIHNDKIRCEVTISLRAAIRERCYDA